jgi:ribosomal protein L37AE/L43A
MNMKREREKIFALKAQYKQKRNKKPRHKSKKCPYCKSNMKKTDNDGATKWECERCGPAITDDMVRAGMDLAKHYGEDWESLSPKYRHMRISEASFSQEKDVCDVREDFSTKKNRYRILEARAGNSKGDADGRK